MPSIAIMAGWPQRTSEDELQRAFSHLSDVALDCVSFLAVHAKNTAVGFLSGSPKLQSDAGAHLSLSLS